MLGAEMARVEVGGQSIAYRHAGQGPQLVLLHGWLCDSRIWQRQLTCLSDQFTVIAWDAPGAGASSDPPESFTTTDWVHCLANFLDALGIERAHVAGNSWGGILAQEFYRVYPARVRTLVLADTYAGWKGSLPESLCKERLANCLLDASRSPEEVVLKYLPGVLTEAASQDLRDEVSAILGDFHALGFRLMGKSSADTDTTALLPHIEVPTLLVWGEDDRRSPLRIADQFRSAIPNAELAVIANAGHVSQIEQPETFNAHIRRFCLGT